VFGFGIDVRARCVGDHGGVAGRALAAACVEHAVRAIRAVACSRGSSVHSTRGKQGELPGQRVMIVVHAMSTKSDTHVF
jgi:hypothetical protein